MKLTKSFWNGLIVILAVVLFYLMVQYLKNDLSSQSTYNFIVLFESVQGLNEGDNVNMLGKKIGQVNSTNITGKKVQVSLSIDRAFNIPVDSEIEVRSEGLMGSKYVSIIPGSNTKKMISDGALVEGKREYDYTMITGEIQPLTQDLAAFARSLRATLGESEKDDIRSSLENIKSATDQIDTVLISNLIISLKNITNDMDSFVKDSKKTMISISSTSDNLSRSFDNISKSLSQTINKLNNIVLDFNGTTNKLTEIVDRVENGKGTFGKLVNDPSLYNSIEKLVTDIDGIVVDFKSKPKKYKDHIKVLLRAQKEVNKEK